MAGHEALATSTEVAKELQDGTLETGIRGEMQKLPEAILPSSQNPVAKIGATLIQDHEFTASVLRMADLGTVGQFLAVEFVLVLALWGFRAKKLAQLETLPKKMLAQAWISGLYWLLAAGIVPGLVWGKAFWTAIGHFMRVALRQILV